MDVLIKGMEMPTDGELLCINIYPDGKVCINLDLYCKQVATAVPVLPHGRLIDADAVIANLKATSEEVYGTDNIPAWSGLSKVVEYLTNAPTIIPASNEGET